MLPILRLLKILKKNGGSKKESGLSNKQLDTMVSLNNDLVDQLPGATEKITDQGGKIAGTTSELRKYNDEMLKMATLELEGEYYEVLENQSILAQELTKQQDSLNASKEKQAEVDKLLNQYTEEELKDLKEETKEIIQQNQTHGMRSELLAGQRKEMNKKRKQAQDLLRLIEGGRQGLKEQSLELQQQINSKEQQIVKQKKKSNNLIL